MEPLPLKYSQTGTRPSIVVSPGMNNTAVNPPVEWSNVPAGTNAFVLMLSDHVDTLMWAVVNLPGDVRSLPEAIPNGNQSSKLPAGLFHRSFRSNGWTGLAKLRLVPEAPGGPLRRRPRRTEHDGEDDEDLAPKDFGR